MLTRDGRERAQTLWIIGQYVKKLLMKDDFCLKTHAWRCRINSSEIYSNEPPCPLTLHCQSKNNWDSVASRQPASAKGHATPVALLHWWRACTKIGKTVHHLLRSLSKTIYSFLAFALFLPSIFLFLPHLLFLLATVSRNSYWLAVLRIMHIKEAECLVHGMLRRAPRWDPQMESPQIKLLLSAPVWLPAFFLPLFGASSCNRVRIKLLPNVIGSLTEAAASDTCFLFRPGFL